MPEEERLNLVSEVEDQFSEPLDRLERALDDVDDAIADTGRGRDHVRIDVEANTADATAELEAFDEAVERLDDDVTVDAAVESPDGPVGTVADTQPSVDESDTSTAPSGGVERETFSVDNIDEWAASVEPHLDRGALGARGGEVSNVDVMLDRELDDLVDFDAAVDAALDDDSDIDLGTLEGVTAGGPVEFRDAVGELDDENLTLLGESGGARKELRRLRSGVSDLRLTMGAFQNTLAATYPLMGVFAGALPAAVVGVGALATAAVGAAGALAGIGALGLAGISLSRTGEISMQPVTNRLSEVGDAYAEAFAPLMQSFAPVVEDALTSIELMAAPLADASQGLLAFRDEFQGVVGFATSAIPSMTEELLAFTEAAMPLLSSLGGFLADVDVFGVLASQLNQALPSLLMISSALVETAPLVLQLSQGFLVAAGAVAGFVGAVAGFLGQYPMVMTALGAMAGGLLVLVTATSLYSIATGGLIGSLAGLASTVVTTVIPSLNAQIASLLGVAAASWQAYAATTALLGVLTLGGAAVLGTVASQFGKAGGRIASARKELEKFAEQKNALDSGVPTGGGGYGSGRGRSNPYVDQSTTVINAGDRYDAARQQYSNQYERQQHVDSVFG